MTRIRSVAKEAGRRPSRFEFSKVTADFECEGTRCGGWLYRPDRPADPPVVVMANGMGAERTFGLPQIAERYAECGYAVFLFDHRHFGASDGEPRNLVSPARQVADWQAAVEHVRDIDGVDSRQVVLWGISYSGGNVLVTAAESDRISAVVSLVPFLDGRAQLRAAPLRRVVPGLTLGALDRLASVVGRSLPMPIVGDPGERAVITAPGAKEAYLDLVPPESDWENATPARVLLSSVGYRPIEYAGEVDCPTLFVGAVHDEVIPRGPLLAAADRVENARFVDLPTAHFELLADDWLPEQLGYQFAFLDAVLD